MQEVVGWWYSVPPLEFPSEPLRRIVGLGELKVPGKCGEGG